jgi:hypothetical protein
MRLLRTLLSHRYSIADVVLLVSGACLFVLGQYAAAIAVFLISSAVSFLGARLIRPRRPTPLGGYTYLSDIPPSLRR